MGVTTLLLGIIPFLQMSSGGNTTLQCTGKMGTHDKDYFNTNACAWCYFFLFPNINIVPGYGNYLTVVSNSTSFPIDTRLMTDTKNSSSLRRVCSTLDEDECDMWKICCNAAVECCNKQINTIRTVTNTSCAITWDGYACWEGGTPGSNSYLACPSYLQYSMPSRMAVKTCRANGTWLTKDSSEWTDYTSCLSYKDLRITIFISLGCEVASLILLVPSLGIFLNYKSLRRQHRIRLHINFFLSFIIGNAFNIMWNVLVTYDKLTNTQVTDTLIQSNPWTCKLLSFLKLYFTSTNYAWMFCEGLYLYRLISNAFSPPKRLLWLYLAGWGIPFTYCSAYAVIRLVSANESCWAISIGDKEWILYAPNLTCLVMNIFFLCSILRILVTQLQAHPNEPSNFRRALKATFVLIPLFGVQLGVTVYRLAPESPVAVYYERISEIITNSQGFVVALIFCFFNGEVASQIKRSWRRVYLERVSGSRRFNTTLSLHFNNSMSQRTMDNTQSRRNSLEPCLKDGFNASSNHSQESQPL